MTQTNSDNGTSGQQCTFKSADGLTLHYVDYDGGSGVKVLCLHGVSRNARDFSKLATHLQVNRRVICLDFRGRGRSDWDPNPQNYQAPVYVEDALTLLTHLGLNRVLIIGTSLGGIVGGGLAQTNPDHIAGIVLNDIGPVIDPAGLARIGGKMGKDPHWPDWNAAAQALKSVNAIVHPNFTDDDWLDYAHNTCRMNDDGVVVQDYDPAIAQAFGEDQVEQLDLWPVFDALNPIPALLMRGALSDLLSAETAIEMTQRLPNLELVTVPDCGHVPTMTEPVALSTIDAFVTKVDALEGKFIES